jgi:hypothetical protein
MDGHVAKHRSSVFAVVRERDFGFLEEAFEFEAIIGAYLTLARAEEVAEASLQEMKDKGMQDGEFKFYVAATTYYDE